MTIREQLEQVVHQALKNAVESGALALEEVPVPSLERPRDESHGDWACTIAMRLAKVAKMNPRAIAEIILQNMPENTLIQSSEIAGPGFINFTLTPESFQFVVASIRTEKEKYGQTMLEKPCKVNLEYVSANPTGPMHVGHGRWAALGDAMARILRFAGYEVSEEFYVNDAGVQMDVFARSIYVRYHQLLGRDIEMPEKCYGGAYVADIAQELIERDGDIWLSADEDKALYEFREYGYARMREVMKSTLDGFGTTFDTWFSERTLYQAADGGETPIQRALRVMTEKGFVFEKDGATWFRSTDFKDDKDRVLIKENGEYTYFMSDMAYHYDKVCRGYDKLIDIWGADHHGYVARCKAMLAAWGYPDALEVVLGQLVNLLRDGTPVRMSKRTGEMITFAELIDEVGVDATRYLMLSRSSDQPIDFDIEVAKKQDASNPVYYVQYAHARICSILRKAAEHQGIATDGFTSIDELVAALNLDGSSLESLTHESELALMRKMDDFSDMVANAARDRAPFRLTHYAQELASLFHSFYTNCHVLVEDELVMKARLCLADAARLNLASTLSLLGVSAPTKM